MRDFCFVALVAALIIFGCGYNFSLLAELANEVGVL